MHRPAISLSLLIVVSLAPDQARGQMIEFRLDATDIAGNPIESVGIGDEFDLHVFVRDTRPSPQGVFSVFLDVTYDAARVSLVQDSLTFGDMLSDIPSGDPSTRGLLDEVGAFASGVLALPPIPDPLGSREVLLFSSRFRADTPGVANFTGDPADILPRHATTLHGFDHAVPAADMAFLPATVNIVPEPAGGYLLLCSLASLLILAFSRPRTNLYPSVGGGGDGS